MSTCTLIKGVRMLKAWLDNIFGNAEEDKPQSSYHRGYEIYLVPMWKPSGKKYYFVQINKEEKEISRAVEEGLTSVDIINIYKTWLDENF
jgi:hypothetical protein